MRNDNSEGATKEPTAIVENRELDRQRVEAFNRKDVEQLMMMRWNSPDLVDVFPDGTVYRGWDVRSVPQRRRASLRRGTPASDWARKMSGFQRSACT